MTEKFKFIDREYLVDEDTVNKIDLILLSPENFLEVQKEFLNKLPWWVRDKFNINDQMTYFNTKIIKDYSLKGDQYISYKELKREL